MRNTCTQQPSLVYRIDNNNNVPIRFKLIDSCKNFATNLNADNQLGLGSKKCSKHFTCTY